MMLNESNVSHTTCMTRWGFDLWFACLTARHRDSTFASKPWTTEWKIVRNDNHYVVSLLCFIDWEEDSISLPIRKTQRKIHDMCSLKLIVAYVVTLHTLVSLESQLRTAELVCTVHNCFHAVTVGTIFLHRGLSIVECNNENPRPQRRTMLWQPWTKNWHREGSCVAHPDCVINKLEMIVCLATRGSSSCTRHAMIVIHRKWQLSTPAV